MPTAGKLVEKFWKWN